MLIHFLRQRDGHEQISQIDEKLRYHQLHERAAFHHERQSGKLTGRRYICERDQRRLPPRQSHTHAEQPEGERHGQIAQTDRNTVTQSLCKVLFHFILLPFYRISLLFTRTSFQ